MKKLLSIITLTAFFATFQAASFAAETKTKATDPSEPSKRAVDKPAEPPKPAAEVSDSSKDGSKPVSYFGTVASVDAAAKSFTFKNKDGKERVFMVGAETKITDNDKPADFEAIKVGSYATGSYKKSADGKVEAGKVSIGPKPAKKEKTEDTAKPASKEAAATATAEDKPKVGKPEALPKPKAE